MTQALYRKWRPQSWDEVIAQEHVIQTLKNAVANDRVAHAFLFAGPRGTGKTTTARILAKAVNCLDPNLNNRPCNVCEHCQALYAGRFMDLIEIDAASNTSVDDVRDLREKINFSPSQGRFKVYIIDEVHMLSNAAFNALLKTLEEPPPHAIFVLATTEIHKIPATVLSRCQRHEFRRIPIVNLVAYLKEKSNLEGINVDEPVFTEIARQATGSLRDAVSLLDQLTSAEAHITLEMAQKVLGTATSLRVIDVIDALLSKDAKTGLALINAALDSGVDARQFSRQVVTYLRNVLLFKMGNKSQVEASDATKEALENHSALFSMSELLRSINAFNEATTQEHFNWHPGLALELAFTGYLSKIDPVLTTDQLADAPLPPVATQSPPKASQGRVSKEKLEDIKFSKEDTKTTKIEEFEASSDAERIAQSTSVPKEISDPDHGKAIPVLDVPQTPQEKGISIIDIQKAWPKIKNLVKQHNPRTEGLLNTSKLSGIKGNAVILSFSSKILKEMMEKEGNITLTMDVIEEVLGQPMEIECIVSTHDGNLIPEDLNIDHDGMVSAATRDLGGRISRAKEDK